jgi:metal-responsive CopG/Arc/MetJ family transcriptional regulator
MQLVTFKLERRFLKKVDKAVEEFGFSNRTEFIRAALREKIEELKLKKAVLELKKKKESMQRKKEMEVIGEALEEMEDKFKGVH